MPRSTKNIGVQRLAEKLKNLPSKINQENLRCYFPIFEWGKDYSRSTLSNDLTAALIVTLMLIPQSMAYALLAGLPPQVGLYAAILPLIAYSVFGTSRALAVGPVAVISLMTAAAVGELAASGSDEYLFAAATLALLSGIFLMLMGIFRLGFIANFLSHPVIAGFITAASLIIAASQLKYILGIPATGQTLVELIRTIFTNLPKTNLTTLCIGTLSIVFLIWVRRGIKSQLTNAGISERIASLAAKSGPALIVVLTTLLVWAFSLDEMGVAIVKDIPIGLPSLSVPAFDEQLWSSLFWSAIFISLVGFVESISVAKALAAKKRQRIKPDQELIGLGAANMAAGVSGAYPVTGGFARSVVNFDAGAETPAAGAFTAIGIALATLFLTPALYFLPRATLAAIIIVAVISLVDFKIFKSTWDYSRRDFTAALTTLLLTLFLGVEIGITAGIALSIFLFLYYTSNPHIAAVGLVAGTEHFRSCARNNVKTDKKVYCARVDQSLYFTNAGFVEDYITETVETNKEIKHFVLMCSPVNDIDATALESLEAINHYLETCGIKFHLSEVKGPVLDKLKRSNFLNTISGQIFRTQYEAFSSLSSQSIEKE